MIDKITIVGAGSVGESTAQLLAMKELAREIALLDIREGVAAGVALDIQESSPLERFDTQLCGDTDAKVMEGSDLVVITAGLPRKPGMSRSDVLDANLAVIRPVVDDVMRLAPDAMIIMVTNPVDVLTYDTWRRTGWDRRRIFGLSGVLDSARMATFIALETGFSAKDVTAMVLGGHGDAMVPLPRFSCICGIPMDQFLGPEAMSRIFERTKQGGAEILSLKKMGSANVAPAASITAMIDSVVYDRRRILTSVAILDGEYQQQNIAMGAPTVLSRVGVERVVELNLIEAETAMFTESANGIRSDITRIHSPD